MSIAEVSKQTAAVVFRAGGSYPVGVEKQTVAVVFRSVGPYPVGVDKMTVAMVFTGSPAVTTRRRPNVFIATG